MESFALFGVTDRDLEEEVVRIFMLDLICAYENYLAKVKQASANTISSYMRDIRQFAQWLRQNEDTDVVDASQVNISDYLSHLEAEGALALRFPEALPA